MINVIFFQKYYVMIHKKVLEVHSHTGMILINMLISFCVTFFHFSLCKCLLGHNKMTALSKLARKVDYIPLCAIRKVAARQEIYRGLVSLCHCYNRVNNLLLKCSPSYSITYKMLSSTKYRY